jgi:hypothetical protein
MALVNCAECGGAVSTSSLVCVHCGAPTATALRKEKQNTKVAYWAFFVGGTAATFAAGALYYDRIFGASKDSYSAMSPFLLIGVFVFAGMWCAVMFYKAMSGDKGG